MRRQLGLGDHPSEVGHSGYVGVRSMAKSLVEGIDAGEFVRTEFEVEDVEVFRDAARVGGLRDGRAALLKVPPQHDLSGALPVCFCYGNDRRVLHHVRRALLAEAGIEGDAADRRPRLG